MFRHKSNALMKKTVAGTKRARRAAAAAQKKALASSPSAPSAPAESFEVVRWSRQPVCHKPSLRVPSYCDEVNAPTWWLCAMNGRHVLMPNIMSFQEDPTPSWEASSPEKDYEQGMIKLLKLYLQSEECGYRLSPSLHLLGPIPPKLTLPPLPPLPNFLKTPFHDLDTKDIEREWAQLFGPWGEKIGFGVSNDIVRYTFGEVLPSGVRLLGSKHALDVKVAAKSLVDLGSGRGRMALQIFLEFPNLVNVTGVEFMKERFEVTVEMLKFVARADPKRFTFQKGQPLDAKDDVSPNEVTLTEGQRTLTIRHQDLFQCKEALNADIVICETELPVARHSEFTSLLCKLKSGVRIMTYCSLLTMPNLYFKLSQIEHGSSTKVIAGAAAIIPVGSLTVAANLHPMPMCLLPTSWSKDGHPFELWCKM